MAGVLQHLRSSTLNKRPNPASMVDGQIAINYASGSPGAFFKDTNGNLVKVGPVHVGATAPNVSPASGGTAGNSLGEQWLDTSGGTYVFKIWDGAAWRSEAGEFVNVTGDTMTGSLTMGPSANLVFEGSTDDGFETTLTVVDPTADRTITLPNISGTVVTTGDSGTVTSTMIADSTIVNGDVNASAAIAGTKISPDFGSQNVVTTGTSTAASFIPTSSTAPVNGIYLPDTNQVAISTSGTGRLFVDASGLVGVGSTAPDYLLTVGSNSGVSASPTAIRLDNTFTGSPATKDKLKFYLYKDANESYGLTVGDAGDLQYWAGGSSNGIHRWFTSGSERARIDTSGRLLVGTSSSINNALEGGVQIVGTGADAYLTLTRFDTITSAPAGIILGRSKSGTKGTNTAVANGDFLGVVEFTGADGGSSYRSAAQIGAYVDGVVSGGGAADMPGRLVFSTTADGASSPTERMRITSAGAILASSYFSTSYNGISTGQFDYDAQTGAGTAGLAVVLNRGNDGAGTGGVSLSRSGTAWAAYSDERAKTDLVPINNGLTKIESLRAVTGRYKTDEEGVSRSFLIAQDVQAVLPEAVDAGDPDKLNLRYTEVIPLLVAALKESKERIETLEAKVAALEA